VSSRRRTTHVVVDTDAVNWYLDPRPGVGPQAARALIDGRACVVSFMTITEIRYGALLARWGGLRLRRLDRSLDSFDVIPTDERLMLRCAELRAWANRAGHPIAQKIHEADRWVASTALALDLELVAGDGIFEGIPGLDVLRVRPS
jgi:predicted nucleic acid-binding protein